MKKVIKIWAPWCGPCRTYAPIFQEFADANQDMEIYDVNVDDDKWQTARYFGVGSIPATVIVDISTQSYKVLIGTQTVETLNNLTNGEEIDTNTEA